MVRNAGTSALTQGVQSCGVGRSIAEGRQRAAAKRWHMSVIRAGSWTVLCLVRWFVFEVLPLPIGTRGSAVVATACRLLSCAVSIGVLSVALQASAISHGEVLVLLWVGSALTAVLIGNVARELLFSVCSSMANSMGHAFRRDGITLGGRAFLETHYPTKTWARWESGAGEFSCEWTEPTGRCNRVEVEFHSIPGQNAEKLRPVIRVITAPR